MLAILAMPAQRGFGPYVRTLLRLSWRLLLPVLLGALVSAWDRAPALLEAPWVGIGATAAGGYADHFATWADLFTWALVYPYPAASAPTVPLPGWVASGDRPGGHRVIRTEFMKRRVLAIGLFVTLLSIWLTTASSAFVWQWAEPGVRQASISVALADDARAGAGRVVSSRVGGSGWTR